MIFLGLELNGQVVPEYVSGKVSFVSSQNTYVKFKSTDGISVGDTLFISSAGKKIPVLRVSNLSSVSCVCTALSELILSVNQEVITEKKTKAATTTAGVINKNIVTGESMASISPDTAKKKPVPPKRNQQIRGSISAISYSDISNSGADNTTRFRYNLSFDAQNIAESKFSFESYLSFRHKMGDWAEVKNNVFNALKIYDLAVRYDPGKTHIVLGRKINPKISSIGPMDGLQVEQSVKNFAVGAVAGTRPDFTDYGFNSKLLQYGAYLSYSSGKSGRYSESSVAFMEQMNSMKTDRRFLYFQHSNSLVKNIYLFSTFEVDLYQLKNDKPQNNFNITGLYFSLRYRVTKNLDITGSFDARKNIVYYETYKSFIDRILEDEMRKSFRLSANYRITNDLVFGVQSGYRFLKSDPRQSKNISGYLTYNRVPGLNMTVTINGTYLESAYMNGRIYGANLSRDFLNGKFYSSVGYRYVDYSMPETLLKLNQNIAELNLSFQLPGNIFLSANYEGTFEKKIRYDRIYLQVRKRF